MPKYQVIIDGERIVDAYPDVVAKMFAGMISYNQAEFFNDLVRIEREWIKDGGKGWPQQLQFISDTSNLTDDARKLMEMIGEYSGKG